MYFELSIHIERSPAEVFAFLRDKDRFPREEDSPVLILEKITPGPTGVGTRYREVVQMLPFLRGEIRSVITRYDPDEYLEEDFWGSGMKGHLAYQFLLEGGGTRLVQRESLYTEGILRLFDKFIEQMLGPRLVSRLGDIKDVLESGWVVR